MSLPEPMCCRANSFSIWSVLAIATPTDSDADLSVARGECVRYHCGSHNRMALYSPQENSRGVDAPQLWNSVKLTLRVRALRVSPQSRPTLIQCASAACTRSLCARRTCKDGRRTFARRVYSIAYHAPMYPCTHVSMHACAPSSQPNKPERASRPLRPRRRRAVV